MKDTVIGVDLAKNIFQVHGASRAGARITGLANWQELVTRSD